MVASGSAAPTGLVCLIGPTQQSRSAVGLGKAVCLDRRAGATALPSCSCPVASNAAFLSDASGLANAVVLPLDVSIYRRPFGPCSNNVALGPVVRLAANRVLTAASLQPDHSLLRRPQFGMRPSFGQSRMHPSQDQGVSGPQDRQQCVRTRRKPTKFMSPIGH